MRYAIANAEDGDTITFDSSLQGATITLNGTQLEITKSITIDASNLWDDATQTPGITIDANQLSRVLRLRPSAQDVAIDVSIIGLIVANGRSYDEVAGGSGDFGGGASISRNANAQFANCIFIDSDAKYGGAISVNYGGIGVFINCSIVGNTALGGSCAYVEGHADFSNCTIAENGGTVVHVWGSVDFYNSIVALNDNNRINTNDRDVRAYNTLSSFVDWTNKDDEGVVNYVYNPNLPLFADAENGDFTLAKGSQAIDMGNNDYVTTQFDLSGNDRVCNGTVDLGAYEYSSPETPSVVVTTLNDVVDQYDDVISLREAIEVYATDGDVVTFANGLNGTITLNGTQLEITKSITIDASRLWNESAQTPGITIDANQLSRVLYVNASDVAINGIAITNGKTSGGQYGGGVLIQRNGSGVFTNCVIAGNTGSFYGGGAHIEYDASGEFINCVISDNSVPMYNGGGVSVFGSGTFTNCSIANNSCDLRGGGVFIRQGNGVFTDCSISGNSSVNSDGGGVYCDGGGSGTFTNCSISGNSAHWAGGGVVGGPYTLVNCSITGNSASGGGGAMTTASSFMNCTISGNSATANGGGISGGGTYVNCAIVMNTAQYAGGVQGRYDGTYINCTISGNTATDYGDGISVGNNVSVAFYNSIVAQNGNEDVNGNAAGYNTLSSYSDWLNKDDEGVVNYVYDPNLPLFADAENGDYSLAEGSQAIDKGNNEFVTTDFDIIGDLRVDNARVDLGAYERQTNAPIVVTTAEDVEDVYDGMISLREALAYANAGDTITFDSSLQDATITLNGTQLEITKSITIDATQTPGITIDADQLSRVLRLRPSAQDVAIDVSIIGLIVANGRSYDEVAGGSGDFGGGASISRNANAQFANCIFIGNDAKYGGAISVHYGGIGVFINCSIIGNTAVSGSGAYVEGRANFSNCTIAENGSAVVHVWGSVDFYNSIVALNGADRINTNNRDVRAYNTLSSFADWTNKDDEGVVNYVYDPNLPLFTDAENGDYSLAPNSQAIDKGNVDYVTTEFDIAGAARVSNGTVDLGAYEYKPIQLVAPNISTAATTTTVTLTWDAVANASGYEIEFAGTTYSLDASETSYTFEELSSSTTYSLAMRAVGDGLFFLDSEDVLLTVTTNAFRRLEPRPEITTTAKPTAISVSWDAIEHASSYTLSYAVKSSSPEYTEVLIPANATSYRVDGLTPNTNYYVKLRANGDGVVYSDSQQSATATVKTPATAQLDAPNLSGYASATWITLSWKAVVGAVGYEIVDSNGTVYSVDASTTSRVFKDLTPSTSYSFVARAIGDESVYFDSSDVEITVATSAPLIVTSADDPHYAIQGSLRTKLNQARSGDIILFDPSLNNATITLDSCLLIDPKTVSIIAEDVDGNALNISVDGNHHDIISTYYADLTLKGLTFANGVAGSNGGGAIFSNNGALKMIDCTISDCSANYGGGVRAYYSDFEMINCVIDGCEATEGGGVYVNGGAPRFDNCAISGNTANNHGGGVYLDWNAVGEFTNCAISENYGAYGGGAFVAKSATFANCDITDNASYMGGGAFLESNSVETTFVNSSINRNSAINDGGGVDCFGGRGAFENCSIVENTSGNHAGGVYVGVGGATLTNCVVSKNNGVYGGGSFILKSAAFTNCEFSENASYMGGGAFLESDSVESVFTNCTITKNSASHMGGGVHIHGGTGIFDNSIVVLNDGSDIIPYSVETSANACNTLSSFVNWTNKDAEGVVNYVYNPNLPLFADAENGDYRLTSTSQATNFGDETYITTDVDLAGEARIANELVDLGAYEYQGSLQLARPALTATKTAKTIALNWDAIPHAKSYTVTYRQMGSETSQTATYGASKTSCTLSNLESSKSYYITIRANGDAVYKTSQISPTITVKTNALQQLTRPAITPGATSASTIEVTWEAVENAKSYTLSYAQRSSNPVYQTATLGANKTSYTLRNLEPNRSYYVKICANGDGLEYTASQQSPTVTIATRPFQRLDRPELTVTATTTNSISVSWEPIANATSYKISYAVKATEPVYMTLTYGASKTSCTIRDLAPDTSYYVKVQAIGDGLEYQNSQQSPTQTVKTLAASSGALLDEAFEELFDDEFVELDFEFV